MFRTKRLKIAAILAGALAATPVVAADFINILTGGQTGVYYPLGVAMEKIYSGSIAGSRPSTQATKASVENLNL